MAEWSESGTSPNLAAAFETLRREADEEMAPMLLDGMEFSAAYCLAYERVRARRAQAAAERDAAIASVTGPTL